MHWIKFGAFNAAGGIVWATLYGVLGFELGKNLALLHKIEQTLGVAGVVAAVVVVVAAFILHRRHRGRNDRGDAEGTEAEAAGSSGSRPIEGLDRRLGLQVADWIPGHASGAFACAVGNLGPGEAESFGALATTVTPGGHRMVVQYAGSHHRPCDTHVPSVIRVQVVIGAAGASHQSDSLAVRWEGCFHVHQSNRQLRRQLTNRCVKLHHPRVCRIRGATKG
jgi:hypothetical protein